MANVTEITSYDAGIYQLETTDPVLGGVTGIANSQAKGLANRTNWLKSKVNSSLRYDALALLSAPHAISAADVSKLLFISDMNNSGFTFPDCASFPQGQPFSIMANDLAGSSVSLTANGSDIFFDGSAPAGVTVYTIRTGQRLTIAAFGTQWFVLLSSESQINGRIPAGSMLPFAGLTAPAGYLKCNGSLISRILYSDLFAAIGTTWGAGDGSTTFAIPDHRGVFLRGLDEGKGYDAGRGIGTYSADTVGAHTHNLPTNDTAIPVSGAAKYVGISQTSTSTAVSASYGTETAPKNNASPFIIKY